MILDYTTIALPYQMAKRNKVLVLQSASGIDIAHAVSNGVKNIVAVESNPVILSILKNEFAAETDSLFHIPGLKIHNLEPRTFLTMDTSHFDLIALPVVGTFGGSSGLYALHEQFMLTREAFREMWLKLNPGGVVSVTSWMDYPVRNPLKILATMVEVLQELGIENPKKYIVAVRSWGTITFVMKRSPVSEQEAKNIRSFCETMMFDPAILSRLDYGERTRYNQFQDDHFFDYLDKIFSPARETFYADYDFKIKPATDNKPYFSQYMKWGKQGRLTKFFGNRSLPFFEIGYLLVIITLIQISIAAFILILLPLFKIGWSGKSKTGILLYFSGIGVGYMLVEMVFIQWFILYLGNPVYSASAVITVLLIFSGLGSYFSNYFSVNKFRLLRIFIIIILMLIGYSFFLTPLLQETVHGTLFLKLLIIVLVIAPLAFCMGIPFPAGISHVGNINAAMIPWAWGINGCVSVISTVIATIIAVEMGFTWVLIFGALAYILPSLVQLKWK